MEKLEYNIFSEDKILQQSNQDNNFDVQNMFNYQDGDYIENILSDIEIDYSSNNYFSSTFDNLNEITTTSS